MLPADARLTSGESFRRCVRAGRRAGSRAVVVHLDPRGPGREPGDAMTATPPGPARVGFIVSRAVGGAVVRNRVRRRLRHLVRERLAELPAGCVVVVRALPAAGVASYDELRRDLGRCLARVAPVAVSSLTAP